MAEERKIDQVLNIAGLLQPQSVFLVRKTLEKVKDGSVLQIVSDDQDYKNILVGVCPKKRYKIVEQKEVHGLYHYTVIKN